MPDPIRSDDAVKFVRATLRSLLDDDDEPAGPLAAMLDVLDRAEVGDLDHYADGRVVASTAQFEPAGTGLRTASYVWHPLLEAEEPASCGGALPDDPDGRSLGLFEVTTDPATQALQAYVVRL